MGTTMDYTVSANYKDGGLREAIIQAAKAERNRSGSGYCFLDGMYDISWAFRSKDAATNCAARIKAAKLRGVKVKVYDIP